VKSWIDLAWNWDFGVSDCHQFSVAMITED